MSSSSSCVGVNGNGVEYQEFSCLYPALEPFYLNFEKYYDTVPVMNWMAQHPLVPIIACVLYVVFFVGGQAYFESRPRWHWKQTLALWNLGLSLFSFMGVLRTGPQLLHNLTHLSMRDNFCGDPEANYGSGSSGLWVQLFILSKFPELVDTFFIVIHKKKLIFLHYYHHMTVLLYCWHSYVTKSPPGIFFVVMNYSVHAAMYFYYFLMAIHAKPKWLQAVWITAAQISQMVVGVAVTLTGFYYYKTEPQCQIEAENNTAAFVMYGSYLFLFLQFFVGRYQKTTKTTASSSSAKKVKKV